MDAKYVVVTSAHHWDGVKNTDPSLLVADGVSDKSLGLAFEDALNSLRLQAAAKQHHCVLGLVVTSVYDMNRKEYCVSAMGNPAKITP